MATKIYDIAVETGRYTDNNGKDKKRWKNIGAVWTSTDIKGDKYSYLTLDRSFNPAGVPCKEGADVIYCSLFKPKNSAENNSQQQSSYQQQQQAKHDFDSSAQFENVTDCPF